MNLRVIEVDANAITSELKPFFYFNSAFPLNLSSHPLLERKNRSGTRADGILGLIRIGAKKFADLTGILEDAVFSEGRSAVTVGRFGRRRS